jgi:hypothetical protein
MACLSRKILCSFRRHVSPTYPIRESSIVHDSVLFLSIAVSVSVTVSIVYVHDCLSIHVHFHGHGHEHRMDKDKKWGHGYRQLLKPKLPYLLTMFMSRPLLAVRLGEYWFCISLYVYDRIRPLVPILRQRQCSLMYDVYRSWWFLYNGIKILGIRSEIKNTRDFHLVAHSSIGEVCWLNKIYRAT